MASSSSSSTTCFLFSVFTLCALVLMASSTEENMDLTITIPLTSTYSNKPYREKSMEFPPHLTSTASMSGGAHHSKHGKNSMPPLKTPLFPRSYGGHSIFLSFGNPPQNLSYIMDTGGYAVEVPCTSQYECTDCPFSHARPNQLPIFFPEHSSSSKTLDCRDPRCARALFIDVQSACPRCSSNDANSKNCSKACPHYFVEYGKGSSRGYFLLENLTFPPKRIRNFLLGCITNAAGEVTADGVAGMDRSMVSLPRQLGVNKFAYCLKSHNYDTTGKSGKLILDYRGGETIGLSHAPFLKNPHQHPNFYYLAVEDIKIGDKSLRIPSKYLSPGSDGSNGVIIDSGWGAAGYMTKPILELARNELKKQLSKYRRSPATETDSGLSPCYDFRGHKYMKIPDLTFQFRGGAHLAVPGWNHFVFDDDKKIACFYMTTDTNKIAESARGPSIILGNNAQVDYYLEYDLKNDRLGFRRQSC